MTHGEELLKEVASSASDTEREAVVWSLVVTRL